VPHTRGQALKEPHVRHWASKFDMPHAFPANLRLRHLNAALVADHAPVLHPFVFATEALPVVHRTEDFGAEQAVPLRFERPIVDCFWLGDFAVRP